MRARSWAIQGWPEPLKVSFRIWEPPEMSESQARESLRAIEGLPDHPDRTRLEQALTIARSGGWSDPETIWYFGKNRLRYHTIDTRSRIGHASRVDMGVDGDSYWTLSNTTLTLVRERTAPDNLNQRRYITRMLESVLGVAAAPGLYAHLKDVRLASCESDGNLWSAVWTRENGQTRLQVSGRLDPGGELLTTHARATVVRGEPQGDNGGVSFDRHEYSDVFMRSVPRVIRMGPSSAPRRIYEILEITRPDPSESIELVKQPERGQVDPIRGSVSFDVMTDWRSGNPQVKVVDGQDGWTVPTNAPQSVRANGSTRSTIVIFGAILAVGTLGFWWFRVR
jgi:hypothetical protein